MGIRRRRWVWVGSLALVLAAVGAVIYTLDAPSRDSAFQLVGTLAAVAGVAVSLWIAKRGEDARSPLDRAADKLAEQVGQQWQQEAEKRGLQPPAPIPLGPSGPDRQ